ncbi:WD40/YVTN/BNR-like repeat-containing protein [Thalassotalea sediminis]|uniref:WD40/YVTN/BNR-like repeat-containing protein n=1 Tax=Thalassotalea sediminis TaxID=1759089 RepID=UPI002573C554|nr:YCF48-related protein [Thalassotalea sediminis]
MIRILVTVLVLISSASHSQQVTKPAIMSAMAPNKLLLDVTAVDNKFFIAVGERGHIIRGTSIESVEQMPVPVQTTLTGVVMVNEQVGWAVGHDSLILHTADGGKSWQIQQYLPSQQKPLMDVVFKNEKEGVAIGSYGLFYRTYDGGNTWEREYHVSLLSDEDKEYLDDLKQEDEQAYLDERANILPHFNRIYLDGRTTYLVGELGLIAKSNDFGKTWQRFEEIYHGSFYDIIRTQQGNLLTVGLRGNVFRTLQNGMPWNNSKTGVTALLNDIILGGENIIYIVGNNGVLLVSDDDGVTFKQRIQSDGKAILAGVMFNNELIVASEVGIKLIQVSK